MLQPMPLPDERYGTEMFPVSPGCSGIPRPLGFRAGDTAEHGYMVYYGTATFCCQKTTTFEGRYSDEKISF